MNNLSPSNSHPPETGLLELHRELAQAWGLDFYRVRALVCQLTSSNWCSVSELIAQTILSHWNVTHLFQLLNPWLEHVVNDLPIRPIRHLDHVSATPLTCLKRALFLAKNYELRGATVLLLGDHDLTSLALAQVAPGVTITVVDSDERILDYIEAVSAQHGWTIRTLFADLRIELPRSVVASCDLVFTDPPYTPEGMRLFLARGLESLKPTSSARLLCCYGFSERHPALGLKVQSVLHDLRLVTEAILPHFNRYRGAQAIASSALHLPPHAQEPACRSGPQGRSTHLHPRQER